MGNLARTQRPVSPAQILRRRWDKTDTHKKGRINMRPFLL